MYEKFKNDFICNLFDVDLKLNSDQINKILTTLDSTSINYDIYSKSHFSAKNSGTTHGVPNSVYAYIDAKRAEGLAEGTIYIYRLMLEVFFHSVKKPPEMIEADDIRDFLVKYKEINFVSNRTLDKYRGYICNYFTYLHNYGIIHRNVSKQVNPIKYEVKHKDILTDYECELLREACNTKRELAMIEFLISTACRIGELVKVKISNIDWDNYTVVLYGKGSKERVSFFNARCKIALIKYLEDRCGDSEYLFSYDRAPYINLSTRGAEKIIKSIVNRVDAISNNKHITAHRFRATTATRCVEKGMPILDVSHILGHSKVSTTQIYLEQSIDSLKTSYNKVM